MVGRYPGCHELLKLPPEKDTRGAKSGGASLTPTGRGWIDKRVRPDLPTSAFNRWALVVALTTTWKRGRKYEAKGHLLGASPKYL